MRTSKTVFLLNDPDGQARLKDLGLSLDEVRDITASVRAAWSEASPLGPRNSPGLLTYIAGVEAIRSKLVAKGWKPEYPENIESTLRPDGRVRILYQNVDDACSAENPPKPISRKGAGSRRVIGAGTEEMFPDELEKARAQKIATWVLCVSMSDSRVKAELSRPAGFEGAVYEDFEERLFLLHEEFDNPDPLQPPKDDIDDDDISVTRK